MTAITLDEAQCLIAAAFDKGGALGLMPLTIAVLDPGGHLVALARQDGSSTLRPAIACGKAGSAIALGVSSRAISVIAAERPQFVASLAPISPHGIIPAAGGVLIVDSKRGLLGAVGVTGDTSDNDELCAIAGIQAVVSESTSGNRQAQLDEPIDRQE